MKLSFPTVEAALAFLGGRLPAAPPQQDAPPTTPVPTGKGKQKPAATEPGATQAAAPATQPSESPTPAPVAPPAEIPVMDYAKTGLAEKISKAADKDRAATVALLGNYGVKRGPDLKPEQFAAFGIDLDKLLAADAALA